MKRFLALGVIAACFASSSAIAEDLGVKVGASGVCYGSVIRFAAARDLDLLSVVRVDDLPRSAEDNDIVECAVGPCNASFVLRSKGVGSAEASIKAYIKKHSEAADGFFKDETAGCLAQREVIRELDAEERKRTRVYLKRATQ